MSRALLKKVCKLGTGCVKKRFCTIPSPAFVLFSYLIKVIVLSFSLSLSLSLLFGILFMFLVAGGVTFRYPTIMLQSRRFNATEGA